MWSATASAAVPWHPDLATARRAAESSRRPVLAVFTASWSSSSTTLDRTTLASDEAVALITACFEPVCIDVDANPDATRRLGISKVPTACIMNAQEQLLAKFELPATPAGFVAAAARAAQEAAVASASRDQQHAAELAAARRPFADVPDGGVRGSSAFGADPRHPLRTAASGDIRGTVPAGGQAINAMAAKVRMLSDFASDAAPHGGAHDAIAASFRETPPLTASLAGNGARPSTAAENPPTAAAEAVGTPSEPAPPAAAVATTRVTAPVDPDFPAPAPVATAPTPKTETVPPASPTIAAAPAVGGARSPLAGTVAQSPLNIEPAPAQPTPSTAKAAPWLGIPQREEVAATPAPQPVIAASPAAPQPPTAAPSAGQVGSAPPATDGRAAALAATKPAQPATAPTSSLLSALQKPFTAFAKPSGTKPTSPQPQAPKPAPAGAVTAAAAPATAPETVGSMPVGLEGYCPVTLAERGAWVEGRAQWGVRHRGRTYLFASEAQQKAFLADPDRYTPMLSGDDPVLALDAGKSTPGQRRYGVTYQSRTYLFSSPETRDAFAANPQRYVAGAVVAENRVPANGPVVR